jgi:hypothetical protein
MATGGNKFQHELFDCFAEGCGNCEYDEQPRTTRPATDLMN